MEDYIENKLAYYINLASKETADIVVFPKLNWVSMIRAIK